MILVSGASGFVGSALMNRLADDRIPARGAYRNGRGEDGPVIKCVRVGDLSKETNWMHALESVEVVVHTAARVHVMHDNASDPLASYRECNVAGTLKLAEDAVEAGVRRFVFVSSIKVNGEYTEPGRPFSENDVPGPVDPYGVSKLEAEEALFDLSRKTCMEVVVVRPPLVYGPGVKANFREMMRWLKKGIPLPFGAIDNRRSLVALDNLVDLLVRCAHHPAAANQVFLAGDGEDVSTSELLRRTANVMGCYARLLPVPTAWLGGAATLLGKKDVATRLCGNLQVDISKARAVLGWQPPIGLDEGLKLAAEDFLSRQRDA